MKFLDKFASCFRAAQTREGAPPSTFAELKPKEINVPSKRDVCDATHVRY